jgi:hypothetical protein
MKLGRNHIFAVALVLGFLLAAGALRADIIFLEDGRVIEGEIIRKTQEEVTIKTATGVTMKMEPWEVTKVVKKEEILKEYEKKRKELKPEDAQAFYELALWCKKHALKEQYEKGLRETLKLDPKHVEARKELDLIEGKVEVEKKPAEAKEEEGAKEKKKPQAKKIFKKKEDKKKQDKAHPFGTVTRDARIPGDLDCKGDCRKLVQGGYMKFDLKSYEKGATIRSASLKVYVKDVKRNPWLWVCLIPLDPTKAPPKEVHAAIQSHKTLLSGAQKVQPGGWRTIRLGRKAVQAVNEALSRKTEERWVAVSLTFE